MEDVRHKKMKQKVKKILEACGFVVDTEIQFNFSGDKENGKLLAEASIDDACLIQNKGKKCLLLFECKSSKMSEVNKHLSAWENYTKKIKNGEFNIISSDHNIITKSKLTNLDYIGYCAVTGDGKATKKLKSNFIFWDNKTLDYYDKVSSILGAWTSREIFKEFGISFEDSTTKNYPAIKIKQGTNSEIYLIGLPPHILLDIGYVSRRTSGKTDAYQRILNKDRIAKISKFIKKESGILPNSIIIAFDKEISNQVIYNNVSKELHFPQTYCSAWIIDGQHRVYGFLNTKYENENVHTEKDYLLPVVAFKNFAEISQGKTFIDINYNQKKIDPTLLCDISIYIKDIKNPITWVSLLVEDLNKKSPLKDLVKINELDKGKKITLSSFARYALLDTLLGYRKSKGEYIGPLYKYAPFDIKKKFSHPDNKKAFEKQSKLLTRFFEAIFENTSNEDADKDPWKNFNDYSIIKTSGINGLLMALAKILEKYPTAGLDMKKKFEPLKNFNFEREEISNYGGGWKGFRNLANAILKKLNETETEPKFKFFGEKERW